jgi:PAS domain S-box-containing protein
VIAQMPVAVMVVEAGSLRVVEFNNAAREMTERELGRAMPERLEDEWEIFHPDGRPYAMEEWPLMRSIGSGEEVVGEECFGVLADGSRMIVRSSSSPIVDDQGEIVAGVVVMEDITEERRVDEERAYHANLLGSMQDAVLATDDRFVLTAWNPAAERMFGWSAREALGRFVHELIPTSFSDQELMAEMDELVRVGRWRGEATWYGKNGVPVWAEGLTVAVGGDRGETTGYLCIMRDITARKRGEEELRYHAGLLANVDDAVIATDADDFLVTTWNPGAERLYGFTAEEVLGRPAREVASCLGDQARLKLEREQLEGGRTPLEFTAHRKDGTRVEVELIAVAVKNERGEIRGYLGIHRDITKRKRGEDALREADARIVSILESSTDEFIAFDRDWRYTYVNRRALNAINNALGTNLTLDHLKGKTVWDLFPAYADTTLYAELERGRREGREVCVEAYSAPDDRFVEVRAFPWDGGLAAYIRDITDRKRVEERLEEAREAERSRIARALHDEALQLLADALMLAIAARSGSPDSGPAGQLVTVLQRVGEQVRGAIYDLRLGVEQDRSFPALLGELVGVQREMAVECDIELDMGEGVAPLGPLGAGGIEVLRILGEALTNARRHANARHIWVRVWGGPDRLCAEVSDDGRGFDPIRPASAIHRGIEGMRERAELLGGRLEIQSELGSGTTVRLEARVTNDTGG